MFPTQQNPDKSVLLASNFNFGIIGKVLINAQASFRKSDRPSRKLNRDSTQSEIETESNENEETIHVEMIENDNNNENHNKNGNV